MRKCSKGRAGWLLFSLIGCLLAGTQNARTAAAPSETYSPLSSALLQRAQNELERIKALVDEGALPKIRLEEARAELGDAQDAAILARTLYAVTHVQDLSSDDAKAMVEAAQRRVDRQSKIVEDRRNLVDTGILAKAEFTGFQDELESRRGALELAQKRVQLLEELRQMADTEQRFERAAHSAFPQFKDVMIRYDGDGLFKLSELTTISGEFEKRFHRALPISALGQTLVHQSMGLDHRNRVDVALSPDEPEGVWLRQLLERLHVPYLAFRSAVAGAATAPHIHIGPESTRIKLALR